MMRRERWVDPIGWIWGSKRVRHGRTLRDSAVVVSFVLWASLCVAQDVGIVSLLESRLRIIRGASVFEGAEGVRLRPGDILETSDSGFAQLEFRPGLIVAIGPSTRLFLFRPQAASGSELVMLSGWLKGEVSSLGLSRYSSPLLSGATANGSLVLHGDPGTAEVFLETGPAEVNEVNHDGSLSRPVRGKVGQFFTRSAGKSVQIAPRPSPTFLAGLPVPFHDTLPSRASRFASKVVKPKTDHEVSYAEIQAWLNIGRSWRRGFVDRFKSRLSDPEFRRGVEENLASHPEWDPVLHPEKYQNRTPSGFPGQ
jgi:hypothetical protein